MHIFQGLMRPDRRVNVSNSQDSNEVFTIAEAAVLFKCSTATIRRWREQGKLRTLKIPGGVRISRAEVERLLYGESQKEAPSAN
jgi:excisionase family DNA binding protein